MTISIRNDKGEEIGRQVVGVGALHAGEGRTFTFSVDVFTPQGISIPEWGLETVPVGGDGARTPNP